MDVWLLTEADQPSERDHLVWAAMGRAGRAFAEAGDRVTWVHLGDPSLAPPAIGFDLRGHSGEKNSMLPNWLTPTIAIFDQARLHRPDVIVAQDRLAPAYGCVTANLCGLMPHDCRVVTMLGDPTARRLDRMSLFATDIAALARLYVEPTAAARSDAVCASDHESLTWARNAGWALPDFVPIEALPSWARRPASLPAVASGIDLSVIVTTYERPWLLVQALDSLSVQTDPDFELIVMDDGSSTPEATQCLDVLEADGHRGLAPRVLRQSNRYLGAARNAAIAQASGTHVILLDDDNVAFPHMVQTFRKAAIRSRADIVTCQMQRFHEPRRPPAAVDLLTTGRFAFTGGSASLGTLVNVFGDATAIYRRDLVRSLGGFHERHGVGLEDWHLYSRAALSGADIVSLPCSLFWYRVAPSSMLATTDPYRNIRVMADSLADALPPLLRPLADFLIGVRPHLW